MIAPDELLTRLDGVKRAGQGWSAQCPAHEDRRASLSVAQGADGRLLLHCHAGCDLERILEVLGVDVKDLFPDDGKGKAEILATYDYTDEEGRLLFQVVRFYPKDFRQRRPVAGGEWEWSLRDTPRVLYRLPEVRAAVAAGRRVFAVEGEKDVHTLEAWGLAATCNAGGAGKWPRECSEGLRGAHVVVIPDNDEAGQRHAELVTAALAGIALDVMVLKLPGLDAKGDVTDWARRGGTLEKLKELVTRPPLPEGVINLTEAIRSVSAWAREPMPRGIDYPWPGVTTLTRGLRPTWLAFMAGYPGHGKTAAAIETAVSAARQGKQVLFVSLEMSPDEIAIRVGQRFGLDTGRLYGGTPDDTDRYAFELAEGMPYHRLVNICYRGSLAEVEEIAQVMKPDLVIVDYLQLMDIGRESRVEGTTRNSHGLKRLAQKLQCAVLCLSQLSRPQERVKVYTPGIFDLKDSGAIEADADQIIFVYREREPGNKTPREEGAFIVAKARMGRTGMQSFVFDGATQQFEMKAVAEERAAIQGWSVYQGGGEP